MQTDPRLMTREEIARELCSLWFEIGNSPAPCPRHMDEDWQAVAKQVQSWLDAPRELRMVPGPPPDGASGDYLIRSNTYGFVLVEDWTARRNWGLITSHFGPILPYEPPKPLTEAEACKAITDWRRRARCKVAMTENGITLWRDDEVVGSFQHPPSAAVIAAAEWIRSQGASA